MNIWGIGPKIAASGVFSFIAAAVFSRIGQLSTVWFLPRSLSVPLSIFMITVGLYFWLDSVRLITTRFSAGKLIVEGVYRFVRNPMYAAFIVFIVPGISLALNEPLLLVSSAVMLTVFKKNIADEEQYLRAEFGQDYDKYIRNVRQIIPFVW